ncbi:MAG: mercuric reductase [Gemmatimonadaceae bacterium]|nr:mercuric reductase [Gemmatimonadaceae bacterium]
MLQHDHWDETLLAEVSPAGWVNPVPAAKYDLVVIGAGTGGLVTAAGAAGIGAKVALIERHLMGGDCLNVGCVPSKGVISAARSWHAARHAAAKYAGPGLDPQAPGDFAAMMQRMRRIRAEMSPIDGAARFRDLGIDVFLGQGAFADRESITVGGATLRFRRAVIATGARAAAPPIPGLRTVPYLTNETIFDLTTLPARLAIIGAGPIGCELAQAFARFGSQVTLVDKGARVLPRDDADAAAIVQQALLDDGVTYLSGAAITEVRQESDGIHVHTTGSRGVQVSVGDALLVAIGRAPNVEGLELERGGVTYTGKGVTVNDQLRTSNARVYAVGDICSPLQFTHAADFQARMVIRNALFFGRGKLSTLVTPWATYTAPELAQVGHTAASAAQAGVAVQTFTVPLHDVDRARLDGETAGFCRVHVAQGSDTIVGATIVAPNAGDIISEVTLAMTHGLGLGALATTMHPYPTQGEMLRKVGDAYNRTRLTPFVKKLFVRYLSMLR